MPDRRESEWVPIYETRSVTDADLVRTTAEVAGYQVSIHDAGATPSFIPSYEGQSTFTISVPAADADDARTYLKEKTSLLSSVSTSTTPTQDDTSAQESGGLDQAQPESLKEIAHEILKLRRQHETAACRYCGIQTLDVSELDLDNRMVALLRAAGLGVNSATFSEFQPGERICSDCAGHEVTCELCGRVLDAFIDEGEYRRANEDEAYICAPCIGRLEDQLQSARDW